MGHHLVQWRNGAAIGDSLVSLCEYSWKKPLGMRCRIRCRSGCNIGVKSRICVRFWDKTCIRNVLELMMFAWNDHWFPLISIDKTNFSNGSQLTWNHPHRPTQTERAEESESVWCWATSWEVQIQSNLAGRVARVACQRATERCRVTIHCLVGGDWNMNFLFSHILIIIPIDEYFSEGLKLPTSIHCRSIMEYLYCLFWELLLISTKMVWVSLEPR